MNLRPNFLDSDPSLIEKNLRFVKNEFEEELDQIFGGNTEMNNVSSSVDHKIIKPEPGMCIKCYKINTNDKFFINLCKTNGILPPEDIGENELHEILISIKPSTYRIPMSISEPRITKDKSGKNVNVCDIAVNEEFFEKCEKLLMFRDFLIAIIFEALSEKYNIQLSTDNWIILKNRKLMGKLVQHRIQNRDIHRVYDSYKNPSEKDKKLFKNIIDGDGGDGNKIKIEKKLIQEITKEDKNTILKHKKKPKIKVINKSSMKYRFYGKIKNLQLDEIVAELYMPNCISAKEIYLVVGEDRIIVEALRRHYSFQKFLNYSIDTSKVKSFFNQKTKMLEVKMPLSKQTYVKKPIRNI